MAESVEGLYGFEMQRGGRVTGVGKPLLTSRPCGPSTVQGTVSWTFARFCGTVVVCPCGELSNLLGAEVKAELGAIEGPGSVHSWDADDSGSRLHGTFVNTPPRTCLSFWTYKHFLVLDYSIELRYNGTIRLHVWRAVVRELD